MELEGIMLSEISQSEKDKYHMISFMWNSRNKTDEHMGRKKGGEANNKRLLMIENKLRVDGGGWARWVMGFKEGTCCDEHRVLYVSDESLNSTPETNITLYVNKLEFYKNLKKNKK